MVLSTAGGSFLGRGKPGGAYVRIAPHEERTLSVTRIWRSLIAGHPSDAFKGNYSQRDVMQEVRRRLKKYPDLRPSVRNAPSFNLVAETLISISLFADRNWKS